VEATGSALELEAVTLDLNPLRETLFEASGCATARGTSRS
jgi:hypothetical protein